MTSDELVTTRCRDDEPVVRQPWTRCACARGPVGLGHVGRRRGSRSRGRLTSDTNDGIDEVELGASGEAPWLLDDVPMLRLLRHLEARFPTVEQAGCRVGIGVATGCDRVFIGDYDSLPVEPSYAQRYQIVCERLVERQLYSAAALELSRAGSSTHEALSPATSIRHMFAEFAGKLLAARY